jgi:hypothetical protein
MPYKTETKPKIKRMLKGVHKMMQHLEFYDYESLVNYLQIHGERKIYRMYLEDDGDGKQHVVCIMDVPRAHTKSITGNYLVSVSGATMRRVNL